MIFLIWFYTSLLLCCGFAWAMADDYVLESGGGAKECRTVILDTGIRPTARLSESKNTSPKPRNERSTLLLLASGLESHPAAQGSKPATPTARFQILKTLQ